MYYTFMFFGEYYKVLYSIFAQDKTSVPYEPVYSDEKAR